jgi:hypothetical protein
MVIAISLMDVLIYQEVVVAIETGQMQLILIVVLLGMGGLSLVGGIFVLIKKTFTKEVEVIANQITKLAQKGIADDVSGLVGNASSLIDSLNQLTKTASGIGIFLTLIGCGLIAAAGLLIFSM